MTSLNTPKNTKTKIFLAEGTDAQAFLNEVFDACDVKDRSLRYGEYGKPYLVSGELFFNLSHCENMMACAVSEREVGVDIQKICYKPRVLKRVCSDKEADAIKTAEDFTRMWVLKESFAKCDGRGLSYGFKDIDIKSLKKTETWRYGDFLVAACYNKD